ncbi:hypothetical protein J2Z75_004778 [Rhizobium herbae]|uniref:Integrase n=1 Tax=Rhizobium herbae TaxID=508661 RepID=A0ABS4ETI0_9HYPH|nr:hypothetical protein [Rhizobium herbae]
MIPILVLPGVRGVKRLSSGRLKKNSQRPGKALADIDNSPRGRVSWMSDHLWVVRIGGDTNHDPDIT